MNPRAGELDARDVVAHVGIASGGHRRASVATVVSSLSASTGVDVARVRQVVANAQDYGLVQRDGDYLIVTASQWPW